VCELASRLLDLPAAEWNDTLVKECAGDPALHSRVLEVCGNYSETGGILGVPAFQPLVERSRVGERLGPWKILRLLGEGGMGQVYLVERADGVFTQFAALKLSRRDGDPASLQRFDTERRILAMLEHPSIARAIDGGLTPDGVAYLVMEYVEGGCPIDQFQPDSPVKDKLRLFLHVVNAVEMAHRRNIVHRDLKPANILVTPGRLPKVLDFGIAKMVGEDVRAARQPNTGPGALTPAYASPEQLLQEPASLSNDIYSLGAVLYKMLTGRPPHDLTGLTLAQSIRRITQTDPELPGSLAKGLDARMDALVRKALDRSPQRRYATVEEFGADLRRYLDDLPVQARTGRLRKWRWAAAVSLLAILALSTAGVWWAEKQRLAKLRVTAEPVIAGYQSQLSKMSASSALRDRIASDEKKYLDGLLGDAARDSWLRIVAARAYEALATHQLDAKASQQSLVHSMALWRAVALNDITEADRLVMARTARRLGRSQTNMGMLTEAAGSLKMGLQLLNALPPGESAGSERVMLLFEMSRLGAWGGNGAQAIDYARRAVKEQEKLPAKPPGVGRLPMTRMQFADAADTYGNGDPKLAAEGLQQTRIAVREIREAPPCGELACREMKAAILTRAPVILINHGLFAEALALRDGVDMAETMLAEDPRNQSALLSLRFGLTYLGWSLSHARRLEECLRVRLRLLEISTVSGRDPGPDEDRLREAIACGEVGRVLVEMSRLDEAQGYFEREAEILEHPPTENVYWFMRQADVHSDLGLVHERLGRHEHARAEFARASSSAVTFLEKTGSTRAKAIEAEMHYLQGRALLRVDKAGGWALLHRSLSRFREIAAAGAKNWESKQNQARKAVQSCP